MTPRMSDIETGRHARKVWRETWTNFSVLRFGWLDGLLISSKNSGTHWLKYMLCVALADRFDIARPRYYSEQGTERYIGSPRVKLRHDELPKLAFSHTIPHRLLDFPIARTAIGTPPIVLLTRHPAAILASHYEKWREVSGLNWTEFLRGDPSGQTYKCDIYWLARFWNRWGRLLDRADGSVLLIRYTDLIENTETTLARVSRHLSLDLSVDHISSAIDAGSKSNMARQIDPGEEPNIIQSRPVDTAGYYDQASLDIYQQLAERLFDYDLGYDLQTVKNGDSG